MNRGVAGGRRAGLVLMLGLVGACAGPEATAPATTLGSRFVPPVETPGVGTTGPLLPTLVPDSVLNRVPTRVRIPDLDIDLPVVGPPPGEPNHFPYCNVAEYLPALSRPGRPGATFIYAHARAGMFLPIHDAASRNAGRSLLGLEVLVYSSDELRFTYEVTEVRRHIVSLEFAYRTTAEQLILQTSEGPRATREKTVVIATPHGHEPASPDEARPSADPIRCS